MKHLSKEELLKLKVGNVIKENTGKIFKVTSIKDNKLYLECIEDKENYNVGIKTTLTIGTGIRKDGRNVQYINGFKFTRTYNKVVKIKRNEIKLTREGKIVIPNNIIDNLNSRVVEILKVGKQLYISSNLGKGFKFKTFKDHKKSKIFVGRSNKIKRIFNSLNCECSYINLKVDETKSYLNNKPLYKIEI